MTKRSIFYLKSTRTRSEIYPCAKMSPNSLWIHLIVNKDDQGRIVNIEVFQAGESTAVYRYFDGESVSVTGNELRWISPQELLHLVQGA